jgi:hypothetical protein
MNDSAGLASVPGPIDPCAAGPGTSRPAAAAARRWRLD